MFFYCLLSLPCYQPIGNSRGSMCPPHSLRHCRQSPLITPPPPLPPTNCVPPPSQEAPVVHVPTCCCFVAFWEKKRHSLFFDIPFSSLPTQSSEPVPHPLPPWHSLPLIMSSMLFLISFPYFVSCDSILSKLISNISFNVPFGGFSLSSHLLNFLGQFYMILALRVPSFFLYTLSQGNLICKHKLSYFFYANDSQRLYPRWASYSSNWYLCLFLNQFHGEDWPSAQDQHCS